ncbi:MAG: methyltransferase, partial [Myxococcota bacterium]
GAGVGAVGHSMLHFGAADRVTMIEIDPYLAGLAAENAAENGWGDCITVTTGNVADPCELDADLVVCNPPYVPPGRGRLPAAPIRTAKHGELDVFLDAARAFAGRRARACFVYPAIEATTLLAGLRARGLEPKRIRSVQAHATDAARVVLVEAVAGRPGGLLIEPPFIERAHGAPSLALDELLRRPRMDRVVG